VAVIGRACLCKLMRRNEGLGASLDNILIVRGIVVGSLLWYSCECKSMVSNNLTVLR